MAKPEHYTPRLNDPVLVEGVVRRLVVVGLDDTKEAAVLSVALA